MAALIAYRSLKHEQTTVRWHFRLNITNYKALARLHCMGAADCISKQSVNDGMLEHSATDATDGLTGCRRAKSRFWWLETEAATCHPHCLWLGSHHSHEHRPPECDSLCLPNDARSWNALCCTFQRAVLEAAPQFVPLPGNSLLCGKFLQWSRLTPLDVFISMSQTWNAHAPIAVYKMFLSLWADTFRILGITASPSGHWKGRLYGIPSICVL